MPLLSLGQSYSRLVLSEPKGISPYGISTSCLLRRNLPCISKHRRTSHKTSTQDTLSRQMAGKAHSTYKEGMAPNSQLTPSYDDRQGELDNQLVDEFDYLSVNHFFNLFDCYFAVIFPSIPDSPEITYKETRSLILSRCKNIKSLRDPVLGHPSEIPIGPDTAFDMLNSAPLCTTAY